MRIPKKILQSIYENLLPTACIACQQFQASPICTKCLDILQNAALFNYQCCRQCGIALLSEEVSLQHCATCQIWRPYFDETYCLDRYEGMLQNPLHQFKYQKRIAYADALSMAWNLLLSPQFEKLSANYMLPVPLSIQKLAQRGFNQSWEIAKRIRCQNTIQKTPYVLKRDHYAEHQVNNNLSNRHLAIQGIFSIEKNHLERIQNKTIIVFDDVMTSGATLNEIARVLKDNGASRVINWVLLRTSRPIERAQHV